MATSTTLATDDKLRNALALAADPHAPQGERDAALAAALRLTKASPIDNALDEAHRADVKKLAVPPTGAKVTYFSGAVVKDKAKRAVAVAPSGFGVRVSAGGARPSF